MFPDDNRQITIFTCVHNDQLFTSVLNGTLDDFLVTEANTILDNLQKEDSVQFCHILSRQIANETIPDISSRIVAGQLLKNILKGFSDKDKEIKIQFWLSFPQELRQVIVNNVKQALRSTHIPVANSSAGVLAAIGQIEIPALKKQDIFLELMENVRILQQNDLSIQTQLEQATLSESHVSQNTEIVSALFAQHSLNMNLKRASLTCLRYLSEDMDPQCLSPFQDPLLTLIVTHGLDSNKPFRNETDDEAELEALKSLCNVLPAVHERLSQPAALDLVMSAVMGSLRASPPSHSPDTRLQHRLCGYQCLLVLVELYYPFVCSYAEAIFAQTLDSLRFDVEDIRRLALEVWTVIGEVESELLCKHKLPSKAATAVGRYFDGVQVESLNKGLCRTACDQLTGVIWPILQDTPEHYTPDTWDLHLSALLLFPVLVQCGDSFALIESAESMVRSLIHHITPSSTDTPADSLHTPLVDEQWKSQVQCLWACNLFALGALTIMMHSNEQDSTRIGQNIMFVVSVQSHLESLIPLITHLVIEAEKGVVQRVAVWTLQWFVGSALTSFLPQAVSQHDNGEWKTTLDSLAQSLSSRDRFVSQSAAELLFRVAKYSTAGRLARKELSPIDTALAILFDRLCAGIERGIAEIHPMLGQYCHQTLELLVEHSAPTSRLFLSEKLETVVSAMQNGDGQNMSLLLAELTVVQVIIRRLGEAVQQHANALHAILVRFTLTVQIEAQEAALSTLDLLANFLSPTEPAFLSAFVPFLVACLRSTSISSLQIGALRTVSGFAILFSDAFEQFAVSFLPELCGMIQHTQATVQAGEIEPALTARVWPALLETLADVVLAVPDTVSDLLETWLDFGLWAMENSLADWMTEEQAEGTLSLLLSGFTLTLQIVQTLWQQDDENEDCHQRLERLKSDWMARMLSATNHTISSFCLFAARRVHGTSVETDLQQQSINIDLSDIVAGRGGSLVEKVVDFVDLLLKGFPQVKPFLVGDQHETNIMYLLRITSQKSILPITLQRQAEQLFLQLTE